MLASGFLNQTVRVRFSPGVRCFFVDNPGSVIISLLKYGRGLLEKQRRLEAEDEWSIIEYAYLVGELEGILNAIRVIRKQT